MSPDEKCQNHRIQTCNSSLESLDPGDQEYLVFIVIRIDPDAQEPDPHFQVQGQVTSGNPHKIQVEDVVGGSVRRSG